MALSWERSGLPFCCGVQVLGRFLPTTIFGGYAVRTNTFHGDSDIAYLATTIPTQKGAIKRLTQLGFKRIARWKRDGGVYISLWFHPTVRKERKRVIPRTRRGRKL